MQTLQVVSPTHAVPQKLFYRINEVSKITGLKPYVLRYWETEFPELSPEKDASDQRRYRARDIETILAIRKLLYEDRFTIKGARQRLKSEMKRTSEVEAPTPKAAAPIAAQASAPVQASAHCSPRREPNVKLGQTLFHLRNEVDELLKILGS